MLAAALWRNAGGGAFHQLQQSLLNTLTRHVAGNGGIFRLAADLVDLVDIDNATLRLFDIIVTGLQELQDNVFHILTDIARFRQRRCIRHGEDRKSVVEGKSVSVRVDLGGRRIINKKKES